MSVDLNLTEVEVSELRAMLTDARHQVEDATLEVARILFIEKRADLNVGQGRWEVDRLLGTMHGLCAARMNVDAVQTRLE